MKESISEFWRFFTERKQDLEQLESADEPVYDEVLGALQQIDKGLYFEFCSDPGQNEFIVSAEGKTELFPLVEEIVSQAPRVDGWQFFALKPKLGFPVTTRWEQEVVTIGDVLVVPVFKQTGEMGLRLYAPGVSEANKWDIHNALLRALDAGLGERRFAERVVSTWVYPIAEAPSQAFPLPELEEYLDARDQKS